MHFKTIWIICVSTTNDVAMPLCAWLDRLQRNVCVVCGVCDCMLAVCLTNWSIKRDHHHYHTQNLVFDVRNKTWKRFLNALRSVDRNNILRQAFWLDDHSHAIKSASKYWFAVKSRTRSKPALEIDYTIYRI